MLPTIDQTQLFRDLSSFAPELLVCAAISLMLFLRLFPAFDRLHMSLFALVTSLVALTISLCQWCGCAGMEAPTGNNEQMFGGLLVYDRFTIFLRCFLYGFAALTIWLTLLTGIPDREDSADFCTLLLGATVGMAVMASSNHLLMVFLGVEMASLPSYAMAGFLKGRRQSSEAALKYVVYGGGAAGVMLYGISLLAGTFGTGYLPDLAAGFVSRVSQPDGTISFEPVLILGTLFLLVGIGFKLAAVPFHFWCPDVFEGAAAEVAGFLSVASKGAAIALLARIALILTGVAPIEPAVRNVDWTHVAQSLIPALGFFAALTATFGNLAAYLQTNLKRLLAYSTIAHAGYMMMGLTPLTSEGASAVLFYLVAYLLMNLGAFAVVAFVRNLTGSEELSEYRGLIRRAPGLVVAMGFFLLSLLGIPPLVGFFAKFQIFAALWNGYLHYESLGEPGLAATLFGLLVIGGLNTVVSAVYYINVLRVMVVEPPAAAADGREPPALPTPVGSAVFAAVFAAAVLALGIAAEPLTQACQSAVAGFHDAPPRAFTTVAQQEAPR